MSLAIHPQISLSPGSFSIYIASSDTLSEALRNLLIRHTGETLYICGNYPSILTSLGALHNRFTVRRALTAYQVLSICKEAAEPLILFEHDRSLFDDEADLLRPIGQTLRQISAKTSTVILFTTRTDGWLKKLEPFSHRMAFIQEPLIPYSSSKSGEPARKLKQKTLWEAF